MTNQQINKAIAELRGWTSLKEDFECVLGRPPNTSDLYCRVPNYAGCLNVMHDTEKVLIDRGDWAMCDYDQELSSMTSSWKWNATARQKAEAFLKTFGKWEEEA